MERTLVPIAYRTVIARVGPQAGAVAHLLHEGAEATLCGIARSSVAQYEDLDEPICFSCVEWLIKVDARANVSSLLGGSANIEASSQVT